MVKVFTTVLAGAFALLFVSCKNHPCHEIVGRWTNDEGQTLIFEKSGKALWLIKFGSQTDSFSIEYRYECKTDPAQLDLSNFKNGPLSGKTLFGIVEWNDEKSFRFDAEPGIAESARPAVFNPEQTLNWKREN